MINKKKATIAVAVVVIIAAVAIFFLFRSQAASAQVVTKPKPAQPAVPAQSQNPEPRPQPALLGQPFADFTLPVYQGGTLTLSSLRGKNVLLLFPRGWADKDYWCTICNYRYVELAELEKAQKIQEKYNVAIVVVFPYPRDVVTTWLEALPGQLDKIRETKNPADPSKLDQAGKTRMERWRQIFPNNYSLPKGTILDPFPILVDSEQTVSKRLDLYRTEWSGGKAPQNIPSVYIIDSKGVLQFKYISQSTVDRPSYAYLMKVLEVINSNK